MLIWFVITGPTFTQIATRRQSRPQRAVKEKGPQRVLRPFPVLIDENQPNMSDVMPAYQPTLSS